MILAQELREPEDITLPEDVLEPSEVDAPLQTTTVPTELLDGPTIPPLAVSGLIITKDALVAALRIYMPQLVDMAPVDGNRYFLSIDPIQSAHETGDSNG